MKNNEVAHILTAVANRHHTTPEQVRSSIEAFIGACWNSSDPELHKRWSFVSYDGKTPTVEDVILSLAALHIIKRD